MSKPLGYYCDITSGSILDEIQEQYGSMFETMSRKLKLYLLVCVASSLSPELQQLDDDLTNPEIDKAVNRLQSELTEHDLESLLISLANQVRYQPRL